eukprot:240662_1
MKPFPSLKYAEQSNLYFLACFLILLTTIAFDSKRNFHIQSIRKHSTNTIDWNSKEMIQWSHAFTFPTFTPTEQKQFKHLNNLTDKQRKCNQLQKAQTLIKYSKQSDEEYKQNRKMIIVKTYNLRNHKKPNSTRLHC